MISYENITQFTDIFNIPWIFMCVGIAVINSVIMLPLGRKYFQIMQQSGYENYEYFKWLRRRGNIYVTRIDMLAMLSILAYLAVSITMSFLDSDLLSYVAFLPYLLFCLLYIKGDRKRRDKCPLVFTHRMVRLMITYLVVFLFLNWLILFSLNAVGYLVKDNEMAIRLRFCIVCITPIAVPLTVWLSAFINRPFENARNRKYVEECKATLYENRDVIKIGITGSYGKTSVKEILRSILEVKYKVLATPASYNTPMGICKSVKSLDSTYDVFIAEMGARHPGDIKELTKIVKPQYAIINGIIEQHMETFSSLAEVKRTKFELVENMTGGVVVLSSDSENTLDLKSKCTSVKVLTSGVEIKNLPDVYAENIELSPSGSRFVLNLHGQKIITSTILLGKHNITNICLAAALSHELGLTAEEIAAGIGRIQPISHRLELVSNENGITIIDDSYNSNISGTQAALEVLNAFSGRKLVLTPGMVELGRFEDSENYAFGKRLAKIADYVILVGKQSSTYRIYDGLISEEVDDSRIIFAKDLDAATDKLSEIMREGDVVLYENDLPDKFS